MDPQEPRRDASHGGQVGGDASELSARFTIADCSCGCVSFFERGEERRHLARGCLATRDSQPRSARCFAVAPLVYFFFMFPFRKAQPRRSHVVVASRTVSALFRLLSFAFVLLLLFPLLPLASRWRERRGQTREPRTDSGAKPSDRSAPPMHGLPLSASHRIAFPCRWKRVCERGGPSPL